MPTKEDIFRAFSRDFFSKLLATPRRCTAIDADRQLVRPPTVDEDVENDHHEEGRPKIGYC